MATGRQDLFTWSGRSQSKDDDGSGHYLVLNDGSGIAAAAREQQELERRERIYRGERPALLVADHTVILVDDGLATGMTMRAAIAAVRLRAPAQIVVAVPVIALGSYGVFRPLVDALVWVIAPEAFYAVGLWYDDFTLTTGRRGVPPARTRRRTSALAAHTCDDSLR